MSDALYDRDVLAWAEQQAGLLRRVQAGERLNEPVDWEHLIDEVQDSCSDKRSFTSSS